MLQAIVLAISLSTAGCAVGPNFVLPAAPDVSGYTAGRLGMTDAAAVSGGSSQRFASGQDVSGVWWRTLRSKQIDAFVKEAIANHPNLAAAQAALRQARESGCPVDLEHAIFFSARDAVVARRSHCIFLRARVMLFAFMLRNSVRPVDLFLIPTDNFIEVGRQAEI